MCRLTIALAVVVTLAPLQVSCVHLHYDDDDAVLTSRQELMDELLRLTEDLHLQETAQQKRRKAQDQKLDEILGSFSRYPSDGERTTAVPDFCNRVIGRFNALVQRYEDTAFPTYASTGRQFERLTRGRSRISRECSSGAVNTALLAPKEVHLHAPALDCTEKSRIAEEAVSDYERIDRSTCKGYSRILGVMRDANTKCRDYVFFTPFRYEAPECVESASR